MVYRFLEEGGPWMLPIVAVSIVGLAFILERAWFWLGLWLVRDLRLRRRLLRGEATTPGTRTRDPHAAVLLDLALRPDLPDLALDRARMLVRDSREHLKVLAVASGLGSALGLLGTVVGMSRSFKGVGGALADPGVIVSGLQTALNTTIFGLLVFLVAHVAHAVFAQASANLGADLEEDLNEVRRALDARAGQASQRAGGRAAEPLRLGEVTEEEPALLMTSMIDVIFILLAFFVCVTEIKKGRLHVDVPQVPVADAGEAPPEPARPIVIEVTGRDEVFVDGRRAGDDRELGELLARAVAEAGVEAPVHLSGDREARNGTMMRVVSQLSAAGLRRIEFAVETGG